MSDKKNTNSMRSLAEVLEDDDAEPTGETHIHLNGAGGVSVKDTGKFKAIEVATRPENPTPASDAPKAVKGGIRFLQAVDSWPKALVAVALVALVAYAIHKGAVGIFSSSSP